MGYEDGGVRGHLPLWFRPFVRRDGSSCSCPGGKVEVNLSERCDHMVNFDLDRLETAADFDPKQLKKIHGKIFDEISRF